MDEGAVLGNEVVLWEGYAAWSQFIWLYLIVGIMMLRVALLVRSALSGWSGWLVGAITLLGIATTLRRWGRYVVTNRRIVLQNGWTGHDIQSIPYQEIREVSIRQGLLSDLMGIGTVVIQARQDDAVIQFRGVFDPGEVKRRIQAALVRRSD
ncbi:MAG: PH domain-containing protein [Nitrospira sp.]|nr:PH domain-containing protein [Nitrospira sp.]